MGRLGITEILLIVGLAVLLFGGTRIADVGRGLGEGIKNFKKGMRDGDEPEPPPPGAPKRTEIAAQLEPAERKPAAASTPSEAEKHV